MRGHYRFGSDDVLTYGQQVAAPSAFVSAAVLEITMTSYKNRYLEHPPGALLGADLGKGQKNSAVALQR
jgi:hypothetical protein